MAIWLVRAGAHGEFESKFIQDKRVYVTWDGLDVDLSQLTERSELSDAMTQRYPDTKPRAIANWVSQVWPFAKEIKKSDLVVLPLKFSQRAIQVGEITGDYHYEPDGPDPYYHWRPVKWIGEAIPRDHFGGDLLDSFGAFMTICRIKRNNAEARITAMRANGWQAESVEAVIQGENGPVEGAEPSEGIDLEEAARDQIAKLIAARFKGHGLTRLVDAILRAQGYTTYLSPPGADGGADILAGAGPLGFSVPCLIVEVKSETSPIDRPTVDKLLGAMTRFGAAQGLFVSWSGFKPHVQKDLAPAFFRLRLWSQSELLAALFAHYDNLDDDIKAELPLKRIWTVAAQDEMA